MRIHVLNQHGGIWLDASVILNESLDWVLKKYHEGKYE
jgi:mannosyltransferase OCH1-like enzyme